MNENQSFPQYSDPHPQQAQYNPLQQPLYDIPQQPQFAPMQTQTPKKSKKGWWIVGGAIACAFIGFGGGFLTAVGNIETPETTEEVGETPQACIDALDHADSLIGYFADALTIASDSVNYASVRDWEAVERDRAEIEGMIPLVKEARDNYDLASIECQFG